MRHSTFWILWSLWYTLVMISTTLLSTSNFVTVDVHVRVYACITIIITMVLQRGATPAPVSVAD